MEHDSTPTGVGPRLKTVIMVLSLLEILFAGCSARLPLSSPEDSSEKHVVRALLSVASAEALFRAQDLDGNGVNDYWTGDIFSLHGQVGSSGKKLALIDAAIALADAHPVGVIPILQRSERDEIAAFHGYLFQALKTDPWGNAYQQDTDGDPETYPTGNPTRFAFCAFPKIYSQKHKRTFIIDERGVVYTSDTNGDPVLNWPEPQVQQKLWRRVAP